MKRWMVAAALVVASTAVSAQQAYTPEFIAEHLLKRDQERGLPNGQARTEQMAAMIDTAASQCQADADGSDPATRVADRVMTTRNLLAERGVAVTTYELLDVLNGVLGDDKAGWDCADLLGFYAETRLSDDSITHITAYKMLQGMRDSDIIGAGS